MRTEYPTNQDCFFGESLQNRIKIHYPLCNIYFALRDPRQAILKTLCLPPSPSSFCSVKRCRTSARSQSSSLSQAPCRKLISDQDAYPPSVQCSQYGLAFSFSGGDPYHGGNSFEAVQFQPQHPIADHVLNLLSANIVKRETDASHRTLVS